MKKKSVIRTFIGYYKPHLRLFAVDMACALFISAVDVVYPLFANIALDEYLPGGRYRAFFLVAALSLAAYIIRSVMQYIVTSVGHSLGVRMEADMRRDVFSHIQELSFSFYDKTRTGALMSRCTHDLFEVTELAHHGPEDLFISLLTFIGAFAVMLTIEWRLAMVLLVSVPLMLAIVLALRGRMLRESRKVKEGLADVNTAIESSISGVRVSQAFTNEHYEIEKFKSGNEKYVHARRGYYNVMGEFFASLDFFTNVLKIIVLGVGGYMIIIKEMDMVAMLTFSLYVTSFTAPIRKLTMFAETYVAGMAGLRRFSEIMDMEPEIKDSPSAIELPKVNGDIRFEHVDFSYGGADVLFDLSLHVKAGSTTALVGPSGGGKTTVCHLLPRFYDVHAGRITIDGIDVRDVTLKSLRASIGVVQQDVFLFADSIRENIRYGRMDATDDEIIAAAKAAEIHDDIMAMPGGYDTVAGERGVTLSGGQKQRISIARIFLKNPPILILDEATSALDSVTEARIGDALERLSRGRTTLIIAHRLSTVKSADEIIVIDSGRITERGSHAELMALCGEYAQLYRAQMQQ